MTTTAIIFGSAVGLAYGLGFTVGGWYERRWYRRNSRGGYVRRVPMSSLHPREPKS